MTMVASFLMVGGQLLMPGVAALCRNWPDRDDWQVLQIVIISPFVLMLPYVWWVPPSEEIHSGGGGADSSRAEPGNGLYSTHSTTQYWAHSALMPKQYSLSPVVFFFYSVCFSFFFLLSQHILFSSFFVCSLCILSFFLSFSIFAGFFPSRCAGCWPPSTTGGPKPWCCASQRRTKWTWQPSQTEFSQVRTINTMTWSKIHFAITFVLSVATHFIIPICHLCSAAAASGCVMKRTCNNHNHRHTDSNTHMHKTQRPPFSFVWTQVHTKSFQAASSQPVHMMKCNCNQKSTCSFRRFTRKFSLEDQ